MEYIKDIKTLEALYGAPAVASLRKVAEHLTPLYRTWIERSRFCVLTTVGPDGTDGSPRGDDGPVAMALDPKTLVMPDWRGNNRLDSLRNIVLDGRVSLMFMVPGSDNVVRVNGKARLTTDIDLRARFAHNKRQPATVTVVRIGEVYVQCARAVMRAGLWSRNDAQGLPTVGDILTEVSDGEEGGAAYDRQWPARAAGTMW